MRFQLVCFACAALLPCGLFSCQRLQDEEDRKRCQDVNEQIEAALQENLETGVLLPTAEPCELTEQSFDPRVGQDSVEYLMGAFHDACVIRAERCESHDWEPEVEETGPGPAQPPPTAPPPYVGKVEPIEPVVEP